VHHLRAMTWMWWRFGPQWQERQPGIAATIRAANPDLVALQEVWAAYGTTQAHHLAADLGLHAGYAGTRPSSSVRPS
jgi:endonuclease/exonuclease/phosphatase family metal-dependent hydrolase